MAPVPLVTDIARPFWEGLVKGHIMLQRCCECLRYIHYPRSFCPHCGAAELAWTRTSGFGHVYSFTATVAPVSIDFANAPPLLLAIVELDEGVRVATTIVDTDPARLTIGQRVRPQIEQRYWGELPGLRFTSL